MGVLNIVCLVLFIWGIADVLSGMRLLFWYLPLSLLGMAFSKKAKIGYSKEELERIFMSRNPDARKDENGQWVDENGIPFL